HDFTRDGVAAVLADLRLGGPALVRVEECDGAFRHRLSLEGHFAKDLPGGRSRGAPGQGRGQQNGRGRAGRGASPSWAAHESNLWGYKPTGMCPWALGRRIIGGS